MNENSFPNLAILMPTGTDEKPPLELYFEKPKRIYDGERFGDITIDEPCKFKTNYMTSEQLLEQAAAEIKSLRKQNSEMRPRLEMFDSIMMLLHTQPASQTQGMSEDLVWQIEQHLKAQEKIEDYRRTSRPSAPGSLSDFQPKE